MPYVSCCEREAVGKANGGDPKIGLSERRARTLEVSLQPAEYASGTPVALPRFEGVK
jgi:hypothetical protein